MNHIQPPTHLILALLITIFLIVVSLFYKKKLLISRKWLFINTIVFLCVYFIVIAGTVYQDISLQLALQKFDLNSDGFFSGNEITPQQSEAMQKFVSDTGRTFSVISGLLYAGTITIIISLVRVVINILKSK
ncbi:hypothetical protein [uncultured Dokdonia sp.]|uniref:hypothetical protein n=1 Tax=uncultured Dokdonia sp. TaxID=575653 RepID=UPI0030EEC03D|tara:strand:+ start:11330 stop:11725 length:396 start_codon:yes stop_codon:yes gene_type:complete